jgi:hypothetical protein
MSRGVCPLVAELGTEVADRGAAEMQRRALSMRRHWLAALRGMTQNAEWRSKVMGIIGLLVVLILIVLLLRLL